MPFSSNPELLTLDTVLWDQSYVGGWTLSPYDVALFEHLSQRPSPPPPHLVNLGRWLNHMRALGHISDLNRKKKVRIEEVALLVLGKVETADVIDKKVRVVS